MAEALQFFYSDVLREIEAMKAMSRGFVARGSDHVFDLLKAQLNELKDRGGETDWGIPTDDPLKTIGSSGEYELHGKGLDVHGCLTSTWGISHVAEKKGAARFALVGNASTVIRIVADSGEEIAMWRMEVGAHDGPGACFHAQMLGERDEPPFPKSLSVPRLPLFLATPLVALDFVLGELFQAGWPKVAAEASASTAIWQGVQRKRWMRTLNWQLGLVADATGSPWLGVKGAFPRADLFTSGAA